MLTFIHKHNLDIHFFIMRFIPCLLFSAMLVLSACSSTPAPEGKPLPDLTFSHFQKIPVKAAFVQIDNNYNPDADADDVSIVFPVTPDMAVQRYAERRFIPQGESGTFYFVVEDSYVHHSVVEPDGGFAKWTGLNNKDRYDVYLTVRLYMKDKEQGEADHVVLNFNRYIAIPQGYSLAKKEEEKFKFIEYLIADIDEALLGVITERMDLYAGGQRRTY